MRIPIREVSPESGRAEIAGWVHEVRDLGGLTFFLIRDRTGIIQVTVPKKKVSEDVLSGMKEVSRESLVRVSGIVKAIDKALGGRELVPDSLVAEEDIMENYTPFGHSDYQTIVADIKKFATRKRTAVFSTINGDSNVPVYKELANQGVKAEDVPVVAFSVGEEELRGIDTKPLVGHLAAWNYFMSIDTPENKDFIAKWKAYVKKHNLPGGDKRVTNDPMEATYIGIQMWAQAVAQAGTTEVNAVRQAIGYQKVKAPSGFEIQMDAENHHLHKPVFIGEVQEDGHFQVVWKTPGPIKAQAWSPFIPDSAKKVANWTYPWVCGNCTEPKFKN